MNPPFGSDGKVLLNFEHELNLTIGRCLTKIAFNYLAWVAGAEFVLRSDFDRCRLYVREGVGPTGQIVYLKRGPILAQEIMGGGRVTDGHILTVEAGTLRTNVEAQLALFNSFRYRIVLASSYSGIWFAKGHHFGLGSRRASALLVTELVRPAV
jgi:hypothetical protein